MCALLKIHLVFRVSTHLKRVMGFLPSPAVPFPSYSRSDYLVPFNAEHESKERIRCAPGLDATERHLSQRGLRVVEWTRQGATNKATRKVEYMLCDGSGHLLVRWIGSFRESAYSYGRGCLSSNYAGVYIVSSSRVWKSTHLRVILAHSASPYSFPSICQSTAFE